MDRYKFTYRQTSMRSSLIIFTVQLPSWHFMFLLSSIVHVSSRTWWYCSSTVAVVLVTSLELKSVTLLLSVNAAVVFRMITIAWSCCFLLALSELDAAAGMSGCNWGIDLSFCPTCCCLFCWPELNRKQAPNNKRYIVNITNLCFEHGLFVYQIFSKADNTVRSDIFASLLYFML